jgi:hypothetical protein
LTGTGTGAGRPDRPHWRNGSDGQFRPDQGNRPAGPQGKTARIRCKAKKKGRVACKITNVNPVLKSVPWKLTRGSKTYRKGRAKIKNGKAGIRIPRL